MSDGALAWIPEGKRFTRADMVFFQGRGERELDDEVLAGIDLVVTGPHASAAFPATSLAGPTASGSRFAGHSHLTRIWRVRQRSRSRFLPQRLYWRQDGAADSEEPEEESAAVHRASIVRRGCPDCTRSVTKVPSAREHHRQPVFVGSGNHFLVAH